MNATPISNPPAQFARAQAPIPALGFVGRVWLVPRVNVTGEVTGFKIPDSIEGRYNAHYVDRHLAWRSTAALLAMLETGDPASPTRRFVERFIADGRVLRPDGALP